MVLKKFKDPVDSRKNVYEIHIGIGEKVEENGGSTRSQALQEFNRTVEIFERSSSTKQKRNQGFMDPGLF